MKAKISIYCPPMEVEEITATLKRTAEEPMRGTVTFPDGTVLVIERVIIPPTDIKRRFPGFWLVAACVGETKEGLLPRLRCELPKERCYLLWAEPIKARTTLWLPDGSIWEGSVRFPWAKASLSPMVVGELTATGELAAGQGEAGRADDGPG